MKINLTVSVISSRTAQCLFPFRLSVFQTRAPSHNLFGNPSRFLSTGNQFLFPVNINRAGQRSFSTDGKKSDVPPALQGSGLGGWTPPVESKKKKFRLSVSGIKEYFADRQNTIATYGLLGLGATGVYVVLKSGLHVADFLASTSFYDVAYVSFLTGLASGGVLVTMFSAASRLFSVRPELVYATAIKRVLKDEKVLQALGEGIQTGKFRAYTVTDGGPRVFKAREEGKRDFVGWQRYYEPKKVQMIFQVQGSNGIGMISCDASKDFSGNIIFETMALDVLGTGQHVKIIGSDTDERIYKGIIQLR